MNRILKYSIILTILLSACKHHYVPVNSTASHYEFSTLPSDSLTNVRIGHYKKELDIKMQEKIAVCDSTLTKEGMESTLANFVMRSMKFYTAGKYPELKNQIVPIVNRGGLRTNLNKGDVTVGSIYELMPFDNELVFITITGEKLSEALHSFCETGKLFNDNISFFIENKKPMNILVNGEKLDDKNQYIIATTDYLANGGDNAVFFQQPIKTQTTGVKLRDVIIDYCRELQKNKTPIVPYKNGRISYTK